jgi:DeoR/GlpR family transcriptional regulator of sugar metabolism
VDGISVKHGCTVPTNPEAEVVRQMIERTKGPVIIVADHSKWGVVSNFQIASMDEIDKLVSTTDSTPPQWTIALRFTTSNACSPRPSRFQPDA